MTADGKLAVLVARLRERRVEIEGAALARVYGISDPAVVEDPEYVAGLREAVSVAVEHGLRALEQGRPRPTVPTELLRQAAYAAEQEVSLDTVLRRYCAGHALVTDFIFREAEVLGEVSTADLRGLVRREAAVFERLLAAIAAEYVRASRRGRWTSGERRGERVRMLLSGEALDTDGLDYPLDQWHLAAVARGPDCRQALRNLARALDRHLLAVDARGGSVWGWFGGRDPLAAPDALALARSSRWPAGLALAVGEAGEGLEGWRRSHRQAVAAMPVAIQGPGKLVHYADVALLASALANELLAETLRATYLRPLDRTGDRGAVSRRTLGAYVAAGRNASSAAAALGVSRKTVSARLRAIEEVIGRPVDDCAAELETALKLEELAS